MIQGKSYTLHIGNNLDILPTLPDNSVDSIVTDPPYELGFMGKKWDNSGIAYSVELWTQCLRVLKPGGHLLSFGGTRTWHRVAVAIEDAGFEVRDSIAWMYGSGFPKSLDVSKAIDKKRDDSDDSTQVAQYLLAHNTFDTLSQFREHLNKNILGKTHSGGSAQQWTTTDLSAKTLKRCPTWEQWLKIKSLLNLDDSMDSEVWRLNQRKGQPGEAWAEREVVGTNPNVERAAKSLGGQINFGAGSLNTDITAPATPEAIKWQGWGTALKPAFEPIVVARKPLIGTVAENVLTHGTGGLNIDGSRIGTSGGTQGASEGPQGQVFGNGLNGEREKPIEGLGRWPANVILDEYSAELLDEQSGASRFFYVAKASRLDRNEGLEELPTKQVGIYAQDEWSRQKMGKTPDASRDGLANIHPTVKPTDLMRYLIKLVTPPGGVVLDPFTGSGSTGKAAILEGFRFIGCELTQDYIPIIQGRLDHAEEQVRLAEEKKDEALF